MSCAGFQVGAQDEALGDEGRSAPLRRKVPGGEGLADVGRPRYFVLCDACAQPPVFPARMLMVPGRLAGATRPSAFSRTSALVGRIVVQLRARSYQDGRMFRTTLAPNLARLPGDPLTNLAADRWNLPPSCSPNLSHGSGQQTFHRTKLLGGRCQATHVAACDERLWAAASRGCVAQNHLRPMAAHVEFKAEHIGARIQSELRSATCIPSSALQHHHRD